MTKQKQFSELLFEKVWKSPVYWAIIGSVAGSYASARVANPRLSLDILDFLSPAVGAILGLIFLTMVMFLFIPLLIDLVKWAHKSLKK